MLSKNALKILKVLKEKEDKYKETDLLNKNIKESVYGSQCTYFELKNKFKDDSFSSISATIKFLLDEKYIMTNRYNKEYTFPNSEEIYLDNFRFILGDKGRYYLENLTYMRMSKYLPLSISVLSLLISLIGLIIKLN